MRKEKRQDKIMNYKLSVPFIWVVILFANSCREASIIEPKTENIQIIERLSMIPLSFEVELDSVKSFLNSVVIINSIEDLTTPFETLDLEVPEFLKQYDYENHTFLFRFCVYFHLKEDIKHRLTRDRETGIYSYYLMINRNEEINSEIFFFYTGILVPKISDNSDIIAYLSLY